MKSLQTKHILITGANGFVGKTVVPLLLKKGYRVTVLGRGRKGFFPSVPFVSCDLLDVKSVERIVSRLKFDAVVHLAANTDVNKGLLNPKSMFTDNILMLLNLLEVLRLLKRTPRFVFLSTDRLYGRTRKKVVDETELPYPIESYTASKMCGESILGFYGAHAKIPFVILRPDSIYGPAQSPRMFISDIIQKMVREKTIEVGNLSIRKNFVYVEDVAHSILKALSASQKALNEIYNIGGESVSLREVLEEVRGIVEYKLKKQIKVIQKKDARDAKAEVVPFVLNTKRARHLLGWKPEVSLKRGLTRTVDYFLKNHV